MVIGEPVSLVEFDYDGNERRGLTAKYCRQNGAEHVVFSVKENAAHCRLLGSEHVITLRASRPWDLVPGEIVVVRPAKQWSYAGHPYLSGGIESMRLDVAALGKAVTPLRARPDSRRAFEDGLERSPPKRRNELPAAEIASMVSFPLMRQSATC